MKFHRKGIVLALAMTSLLCSFSARADWAQSTDPLVVQPAPSNGQVQAQNPPGFAWARYPTGPASYEIEITQAGGSSTRATVDRNWYLPTKALALGNYTWRVHPAGSSDWSSPRSFSITSRSTVFEVPDNATLRARIAAKARPRSLPASTNPFSTWDTAKKTELEPYLSRLSNEVKVQMGALPNLSDARWPISITAPLTAQMSSQQTDVRNRINEATRQLEAAALLWRIKRDPVFLTEAIKRADQLAALNPTGPTSYANQDQATRQIALSLIKAIDMLPGDLDGPRRNRWLDIVRIRTNEMFGNLIGDNGRLDQYPFDSHGNTLMIFMSLISTLSLGDIPDAQKWFDFCFRAYVNNPSPWSGPEGGYANGTAYAEYAGGYMVALWDSINQASGVNMYAKPWSLGFLDFAMMLTPPGSKVHAFGDGSETKPDPRVFRAFSLRMVNPRANWYAAQLVGGPEDGLSVLEAPYPMPIIGNQVKAPPSNEAYYPSIGWVAIHSNIADTNRTSFYFKSSPYGSFNHSHGDQNGFLLSVGGQPLLTKAGWYDWYGSPYWSDWYHQTKSQNAITFDGGQGQLVDGYREQLQRNGRITGWAVNPAYDYAEGDATPSYGGKLTMAKRQTWYLKSQNAVLVRDKLSAVVPHTYEFNIHAEVAMTVESPSSVRIAAGGQSVCLRDLNGNAPFATWIGPGRPNVMQTNGAFYLKNDGKSVGEFLVLLDVGCKRPAVKVAGTGASRTVTVGSQTVTLQ